jgi:hypothetical protein
MSLPLARRVVTQGPSGAAAALARCAALCPVGRPVGAHGGVTALGPRALSTTSGMGWGSSPLSGTGTTANAPGAAGGPCASAPGAAPAPSGAHGFSHSARLGRVGHPGRKYFADVRPSFVAAGDTVFEEGPRLVVP